MEVEGPTPEVIQAMKERIFFILIVICIVLLLAGMIIASARHQWIEGPVTLRDELRALIQKARLGHSV